MGRQQRTVARQRQTQRFGQAVHRVSGKHAGTRAAGWAGGTLDLLDIGIRGFAIGRFDHRIDEVELDNLARQTRFTGLHRAAGNENNRDIQAHRRHQHAGRDLVAVGNAHQRIGAVGVDHVFHAVGNQIAAGQRIQHTAVPHRNTVVHRDGVEFFGQTAGFFNFARHHLAQIMQMHMAGYELGKRVGNRNNRFAEIFVGHTGGTPQGACAGHVAAVGRGFGTVGWHG